jgi:hypothetical protein
VPPFLVFVGRSLYVYNKKVKMAIPTRFAQLNVSSDGSNWGYLKSAATTNNLELKPADGSSVVVDAPLYYMDSNSASVALNATLDSFAASISTFIAKTYVDAADTLLQQNIDAEATARTSSDGVLQENIDIEATARTSADTTLQSNVDAEAASRAAADSTLQSNIDGVDVRVAAIEALLSQLGSASP